jgi:G3E family GTPase
MSFIILPTSNTPDPVETHQETAARLFSHEAIDVMPGDSLTPEPVLYRLILGNKNITEYTISIPQAEQFVLFTQHRPDEFDMGIANPDGSPNPWFGDKVFDPDHEHDDTVSSVGILANGALNPARLNAWLGTLLSEQGQDIFRMKGILDIAGEDCRFVFQGVHMLFDGQPDRPWGDDLRTNQLIFIGRNLDREQLDQSFRECLQ